VSPFPVSIGNADHSYGDHVIGEYSTCECMTDPLGNIWWESGLNYNATLGKWSDQANTSAYTIADLDSSLAPDISDKGNRWEVDPPIHNATTEAKFSGEIHVPDDFPTIKSALFASNTGDTIIVHKGIYNEVIDINKSISLIGEDRENTVIRGDRVNDVISIFSDYAVITNFTIKDSGSDKSGINIWGDHNTIINNFIYNNYYGLYLQHMSNNITVSNNRLYDNGYSGIYMGGSKNNSVLYNDIMLNKYGVVAHAEGGGLNRFNKYVGNNISNNTDNGLVVAGNNNFISNNKLISNTNNGIVISGNGNNTITNNHIMNNKIHGIFITGNSANYIIHNLINNTLRDGIHSQYSESLYLANNEVYNTKEGIVISTSNDGQLLNNTIKNVDTGITLNKCREYWVYNNLIIQTLVGLSFQDYSDNNIIFNNSIYAANTVIYLKEALYNTIYNNNFYSSTINVMVTNSENYWNNTYPIGGNYWSTLSGADDKSEINQDQQGGDGFYDLPFIIDDNNIDLLPLTNPIYTRHFLEIDFEPSPSPSPEPTSTPEPSPSRSPSSEPEPEPSPSPSPTPEPEPEPEKIGGGIPGFPIVSIFLGILATIFILGLQRNMIMS